MPSDVRLAVLTPSYAPDLSSVLRLHESVLRHTRPDVVHHVVVPRRDLPLFRVHSGPRLRLHAAADFVPDGYRSVYGATRLLARVPGVSMAGKVQHVKVTRPWPPLRGWMVQQLVKLGAPTTLDADVVVSIDSDVELVRDICAESFLDRSGRLLVHRSRGGITRSLPEHVRWLEVAGSLLGLPPATVPHDDYVNAVIAWEPRIVRALQERVAHTTGDPDWCATLARLVTFSECVLHGRFVTECLPPGTVSHPEADWCLTHWPTTPLRREDVADFVGSMTGKELAVHIQSVSGTDENVRAEVVRRARARVVDA